MTDDRIESKDRTFGTPPDLADLEAIARAEFQRIPDELRRHVADVIIRVDDFPDRETEAEMELESPFELLGLYRGVDLTSRSVVDAPQDVDMIYLYRRPLLDYWAETGCDLVDLVRNTLIHEIGHHFGFSDEDMDRLESLPDGL